MGEHGLGFSVVAQEVRKLSDDTKKSVANVAALIQNTSGQTKKLTSSDSIMDEITKGDESMQETAEHFQRIFEAICETKVQNNRMNEELSSFIRVINEMCNDFNEVAASADKITWIAKDMQ